MQASDVCEFDGNKYFAIEDKEGLVLRHITNDSKQIHAYRIVEEGREVEVLIWGLKKPVGDGYDDIKEKIKIIKL